MHLSVGNQQITEVSDHKVLDVTINNNLIWGPHIRDLCKTKAKKVYQSAKIKHFLNFHARKTFFQAHIQSGIDYASTLWDSASDSLQQQKTLKLLHRRAIKTVLLKRTSLTDKDYKTAQIFPLSSRLMSNKGAFVHKIASFFSFLWFIRPSSSDLFFSVNEFHCIALLYILFRELNGHY